MSAVILRFPVQPVDRAKLQGIGRAIEQAIPLPLAIQNWHC